MSKRTAKNKKKNPMQTAFTRFMLVVAFFIIWIGGIGVRLVHLQVNQHEWLRGKALDQRRDTIKNKQLRGTIYDRSERALAMSVKTKTLFADPKEIDDVETAARELARVLKLKPNELLKDLREAKDAGKRFVVLARKLDEASAQKINEALENKDLKKSDLPRFAGLHWREEQKRSYPYKTLAAHIVGFSNADDIGQAGIEQSQEEVLRGAVIRSWQDRDRLGRVYDESEPEEREPPKDIILTISHSIQYKTELALEKGVKEANARSGMAIVLDPKTGEILAMANYPTFDPNRFNEFPAESFINRAIHDIYSPGSVFKLVTYSTAINENLINPDGEIDCRGGFIEVAGHRFNDSHATKIMSFDEALAVSSNVAAIKTGLQVGREKFHGYAQKFGFGVATGIELPTEAGGILRPTKVWNGDSLASMSIGYEISVTALQMATAFATIANDGIRIQPHIIKEIRHADGTVSSATKPPKTEVVNRATALGLRKMLRQVVLSGTGKRAQLNGYTSAGKTGTAWKYNPKTKRVESGRYVSSFIGFAPADNPSVVIAVVMDEPQGGARDGGQVSAPVFREIAEQVLPELNVIPDAGLRQETLTAEEIPTEIEADSSPESAKTAGALTPKTDKNLIERQKTKEAGETKKEKSPPDGRERKAVQPKAATVLTEKPKNKSSGERTKPKT
jgi:cell division protein FtsI/penicillin-binding protein 2